MLLNTTYQIIRKLVAFVASVLIVMAICVNLIMPALQKTGLNNGSIAAILIFTGIGLLFFVVGPIIFWISRNFFTIVYALI